MITDTDTAHTEQYGAEMVTTYEKSNSTRFQGLASRFDSIYLSEIGKYLNADTTLLDVGCGEGGFLLSEICQTFRPQILSPLVTPKLVYGVDNSSVALEKFSKKLSQMKMEKPKIKLIRGDMAELNKFNLPAFHLITCRFAIHYAEDLEQLSLIFSHLKSLLVPEIGRIVLSFSVEESVESSEASRIYAKLPRGNQVPLVIPGGFQPVIRGYSSSEYVNAALRAGLSVNKTQLIRGDDVISSTFPDGFKFPKQRFRNFVMIMTCEAAE